MIVRACFFVFLLIPPTCFSMGDTYRFPGKYIFCVERTKDSASLEYHLRMKEGIEEVFINSQVFKIYTPKEMEKKLLTEEEFIQKKFHEPTHILFYSLKIRYREKMAGGVFLLEGELYIQKLQGGDLTGAVWKKVRERLKSSDLGIKVESEDDDFSLEDCIDKLAKLLAHKMLKALFKSSESWPVEEDENLRDHITEEEQDDLVEVYFQRSLYLYHFEDKYKEAWEEIEKACSIIEDPRCLIQKGKMLYLGMGTKPDKDLAIDIAKQQLNRLLKNTDDFSYYILGWMYHEGYGIWKDYQESAQWWRKAAEKGNVVAINNLGNLYENGKGVKEDRQEAARLYLTAAEKGLPLAMTNLARMYYNGAGVGKDYEKAVFWYRNSAEKGNAVAMNNLGIIYENGNGIEKDYEEAIFWYRSAAEKGEATAMANLGFLYFYKVHKGDRSFYFKKAVEWWRKAANLGDSRAKQMLKDYGEY